MNPKVTIQEANKSKEREKIGLELRERHFLSCSNCKAGLAEIILVDPEKDCGATVYATCPFCGDKSYQIKFVGVFRFSGFAIPDEDPYDDKSVITAIDFPEYFYDDKGDITVKLNVVKNNPDVKPRKVNKKEQGELFIN